MKNILTTLLLGLALLAPPAMGAQEGEKLSDNLKRIGAGLLRQELEKLEKGLGDVSPEAQAAAQEATAGEPAAQPDDELDAGMVEEDAADDGKAGKRTWRERGRNMVGAFAGSAKEKLGEKPLSVVMAQALKSSVDVIINEYKAQYKAEGRAYARELGDIMVDRVRKDPKISSSITTVQVLCWVVIVYLTLVTIFVVVAVRRIKRDNDRVLELLEKLGAREIKN